MPDQKAPGGVIAKGWRKSSYSGPEAGSCLEVGDGHPAGVPVRDSKDPHGPALLIPARDWASFVSAVKAGGFPAHR
ncbi:DUF397 domain-containing protein [Streptomyces aurantiacus]|uniref:DUF397 domain-containing protein n=1 Tax=Streptomyces aurantiacus TaxID=47760 RepID=A0A7G1P9J2_9ACTN|nr:DUF397 domain-containing protein [Streptomyces aurantiacus]BCL30460.1 hypothetical protein GCM10017557_53190 [Streptomyces aurantiacus]